MVMRLGFGGSGVVYTVVRLFTAEASVEIAIRGVTKV